MRSAIYLLLLLLALFAHADNAPAQTYPNRSIRVLIPALPGDTCDVLGRLIGQKMGERLGQHLVVDDRPGATGTIGLAMVAQATPDGYTIACGQAGNMSVVPHVMKKMPYDAVKDFTAVALLATNYLALVVNPNLPIKTVDDLIKYAKANPGKVSFASNGEGSFLHFAAELFRTQVGITYLHVPFKGVSQMATELIGGRVDAAFTSFTAVLPYVNGGRLRLMGIAKSKRAENYPDFPAIAETVPGFESGGWFGLVAPAATPKNIVALLNKEANDAMRQPDVREKTTALGLDVWTESPEYFGQLIRSDYEKYGKLARDVGMQKQ
jgi:tripartite-type tricarboxylate transporter receptor subunit TctC